MSNQNYTTNTIAVNLVDADPSQPRQHFDETKLQELAQSIKANGLAQPIAVRPHGDRYIIIHGERRWRAVKSLGWTEIPANVQDVSAEDARWLALVENVQRADLNPIEEAIAFKKMRKSGAKQKEIGQRIGKTQSYISQKMRLLRLPDSVKGSILQDMMAEGHARQLLRLPDDATIADLADRAVAEKWTVARTRMEVDSALAPTKKSIEDMTPADILKMFFRERGCVPEHTPYPEETDPDEFDPPIDVRVIDIDKIVPNALDNRFDRAPSVAEWYAEIYEILPPIAVYQHGGEYILADGKYRIMAAEVLGSSQVEARIYKPKDNNDEPAMQASFYGAAQNSMHGRNVFLPDSAEARESQANHIKFRLGSDRY